MHVKFSIITVCYNSERTIRRTIESVLTQTYENIEYIIVDGGSTDSTLEIIAEYETGISKLISEPDDGLYHAMNKGIAISTGTWIHILNSDDYYADEKSVSKAVMLLDSNKTNYFWMLRETIHGTRFLQRWKFNRIMLFLSAYLPHPALIVAREQYEAVGTYDLDYQIAADHEFILRMTKIWQGIEHPFILTVMEQGGLSEKNHQLSLKEFEAVLIKHRIPYVMAKLISVLRVVWWGFRSKFKMTK